jgi:hypothetical protein
VVKNWGAACALVTLVCVAAFAFLLDLPAQYHRCDNSTNHCGQTAENHNQAADYMAPVLVVGKFFDDHAGAVGAVSSIFIAVFTIILAMTTRGLHLATRGLQDFAAEQAGDMKQSIAVARAANAINRDNLIVAQRAWMTIEVFPAGDFAYGSHGAMIEIGMKLRNVGKKPAIDVVTIPKINIAEIDRELTINEMLAALSQEQLMKHEEGRLVIPNDEYIRPWVLMIPEETTKQKSIKNRFGISFNVFGCVTYRIIGDDKLHQTGFTYALGAHMVGARHGFSPIIVGAHVMVPKAEVSLPVVAGGFAT